MKDKNISQKIITILLVIFALSTLYPIVWMLLNSFKTASEVIANPVGFPDSWSLKNYFQVFNDIPFVRYFFNTLVYTIGTIFLVVLISAPFAYATARMGFKWTDKFYKYIQLGLVIPIAIIITSLYVFLYSTSLISTYHGMILVYTASSIPVSVLILYAYMRSLPNELEEAAYIDGCNTFMAFCRIILPMVKPAINTIAIIVFMQYTWNEYFIAFITINNPDMQSLPVAMGYFSTSRGTNWGVLCAALMMSSIPSLLVYLFMSEKIEKALTVSAALK